MTVCYGECCFGVMYVELYICNNAVFSVVVLCVDPLFVCCCDLC